MIINGTLIKEVLLEALATEHAGSGKRVCFVQFGDDAASAKFVAMKMKVAEQLGIAAEHVHSAAQATEAAIAVVQEAVAKGYDGIVVQLPIPAGIDAAAVVNAVPVEMDIDVLSDAAIEAYKKGANKKLPPVAAAVESIFKVHQISPVGKKIVIRGKGKLVGEPVMMLFDQAGVAYDAIDIETPEADQLRLLQHADIIISGIGVPHSLTPDMIKDGVVLIDAGTSEQAGKLAGDIDPACAAKASLYTPVPGGVGPITVACLFRNLFL